MEDSKTTKEKTEAKSLNFYKFNIDSFIMNWTGEPKQTWRRGRGKMPKSGFGQLDVLIYLMGNMNRINNTVVTTYKEIHDCTGISKDIIFRVMRKLGQKDIIRKKRNGYYIINPDILMYGSENKHEGLQTDYKNAERLGRTRRSNSHSDTPENQVVQYSKEAGEDTDVYVEDDQYAIDAESIYIQMDVPDIEQYGEVDEN